MSTRTSEHWRSRPRRALLATIALGVILVVGLTACSSSKHSPSAGGTQAHLENKATEAAKAMLSGKYDASYQYLDAACQKRWTQKTWAANAAAGVAELNALGIHLAQDHLGSVTVTHFTPTSATVTTHVLDRSGQDAASASATAVKPETWVHQDGRWVNSDCPAATPGLAGGSGGTAGTGGLVPVPASTTG